jgi:rRNA maturation endonuclease Nob1
MGLEDYKVESDKFEAEESGAGYGFPCNECKHRHKQASSKPCKHCGHNVNF